MSNDVGGVKNVYSKGTNITTRNVFIASGHSGVTKYLIFRFKINDIIFFPLHFVIWSQGTSYKTNRTTPFQMNCETREGNREENSKPVLLSTGKVIHYEST